MAEFDWDHIQGSYAWMAARQMTITMTMMLLDYEKFYRAKAEADAVQES